jgi:hypothetical protein
MEPAYLRISQTCTGQGLSSAEALPRPPMAASGLPVNHQSPASRIGNRLQALVNLLYLLARNDSMDEASRQYVTQMQAEIARLSSEAQKLRAMETNETWSRAHGNYDLHH